MITLITNDLFYRLGIEPFQSFSFGVDAKDKHIVIVDDGINCIYFVDVTNIVEDAYFLADPMVFLLRNILFITSRKSHPDYISNVLKKIIPPFYLPPRLSNYETTVLIDLAANVPKTISIKKREIKYKSWHNFKLAAFNKLGIKNNAMFAILFNSWKNMAHPKIHQSYL